MKIVFVFCPEKIFRTFSFWGRGRVNFESWNLLFFYNSNPVHRDNLDLCTLEFFFEHFRRRKIVRIHSFRPLSEIHCQYICSKMIHCLVSFRVGRNRWSRPLLSSRVIHHRFSGDRIRWTTIEWVDFGLMIKSFFDRLSGTILFSECFLLSTNLLRNDGSIDIKRHRSHKIYVKVACGPFVVSKDLSGCSDVGPRRCLNGHCSFQLSENYPKTICQCSRGFTGDLCDRPI